jgi:hypothetical protein
MEHPLKSVGKCLFCNQVFDQDEIGKHLAMHLSQMEKEDHTKITKSFHHIKVEAEEMFLHILVNSKSEMKVIDNFLKDIWLDCCGHMSNFGHKNFKIRMSNSIADVFVPKIKIYHDYDYGSTTRIDLKTVKNYALHLKENLILLSRNEPLKLICSICKKKPAVCLCTTCNWEEDTFFCEPCAVKHEETCEDFEDYARMPVVNSPRMGVCGYEGGSIDKERDGIYKK